MRKQRNAYKILVGKPKESNWKNRSRQEDDIKMDPKEIGWECVDWIHLAQDRDWWQVLANMEIHLWVP
jgi:hypothetical protein